MSQDTRLDFDQPAFIVQSLNLVDISLIELMDLVFLRQPQQHFPGLLFRHVRGISVSYATNERAHSPLPLQLTHRVAAAGAFHT
jgi:hypothetical protein